MSALKIHLNNQKMEQRGLILPCSHSKDGSISTLEIIANDMEMDVFFDTAVDLIDFCKEHNIACQDRRPTPENQKGEKPAADKRKAN